LQIHDFNPGITESGLFWTIAVPENAISVNFAAGRASFRASEIDVEDYHDIVNALTDGPSVPATVSFDINWGHAMGRTKIRDVENNFAGDFVAERCADCLVRENSNRTSSHPIRRGLP